MCRADDSREEKPRFKGVELYSWKNIGGDWVFVLLNGTNDLKTEERVKSAKTKVKGADELKKALAHLAVGERIIWTHPIRGFEYPARAVQEGIEKAAKEAHVKAANGGDDYRLRIEHAQVTTPAEIAQFKQLKAVASMQPTHLLTDMRWAQDRLGPKRAATSYAWLALLNKGVPLAFGTDYPVEPVTPFRGLYAAVTRQSADGKQEYFPEQRLILDQAIAAYTAGSAFAEFEEKEKGKLVTGMLADFVVLDRDITSVPAQKMLGTKVLRTVVGGKTVYEAK